MIGSAATQLASGLARATVNAFGLAIVSGEFVPGALLPPEADLAQRFGVGRSALREAVKVLAAKGLIRTARRYGSRVALREEWSLLDRDVLAWLAADPRTILDLLGDITELRQVIEPQAAALAARRATGEERDRIIALAETLSRVEPEAAVDSDIAFHIEILKASHNRFLVAFGASLSVLLQAQFSLSQTHLKGDARYRPDTKHLALAKAIAARDPVGARAASESMFRLIQKVLRQSRAAPTGRRKTAQRRADQKPGNKEQRP